MLQNFKQKYTPFWSWECYQNGMWDKVNRDTENEMLSIAIDFTSDHLEYGKYMRVVSGKWHSTMLNNLTNKSINRKAFIGHCAVSYKLKIPEYITRKAWSYLTDKQQILANAEAKKTIELWEIEYMKKLRSMRKHGSKGATQTGYQMKLQFR